MTQENLQTERCTTLAVLPEILMMNRSILFPRLATKEGIVIDAI